MISVIVPIYNIEKYIDTCIKSVVAQTYSDWELLLINDGSPDSSAKICQKWADTDHRIKLFSKENGGVSSARNLGLELASGEYLFFLDGDDQIACDCLEKMMNRMTKDIDIVIGKWELVNDAGYEAPWIPPQKNYEGILSKEKIIQDIYSQLFYPRVIWGKLYRSELWKDIRFKHMIYSEDTYAMYQVLEKANNLYSINEPLYYYLQRSSGVSQKRTIRNHEDYLITLDFKYENTQKNHIAYQKICAEEYIRETYILLELYEQTKQKAKALDLLQKMKAVYKTSGIQKPIFSQKILVLPNTLIYYWIGIRRIIKNGAHEL